MLFRKVDSRALRGPDVARIFIENSEFVNSGNAAHMDDYGMHSVRKTKATQIYGARIDQLMLVHAKLKSMARYPGIEVNDALEVAEQTDV